MHNVYRNKDYIPLKFSSNKCNVHICQYLKEKKSITYTINNLDGEKKLRQIQAMILAVLGLNETCSSPSKSDLKMASHIPS